LQLSLLEKQQDELAEKESEKQNIGLDPIENLIEEPTEELVDQPVIETEIKTENESEVEQIKLPEESESNKIDEFASLDDLCAETSDDTNFETLQAVLKQVFCVSNKNNQQAGFNPANEKAREIAEKLMRGRQRVAEQNGSANASIFS
jgi:hypothetical protein